MSAERVEAGSNSRARSRGRNVAAIPITARFSAFTEGFPALFRRFCRLPQKPEKLKRLIPRAFPPANRVPSSQSAPALPLRPESRKPSHHQPRPRALSTSFDETLSHMMTRSLAQARTDSLN
jgi:hypothetical protein